MVTVLELTLSEAQQALIRMDESALKRIDLMAKQRPHNRGRDRATQPRHHRLH